MITHQHPTTKRLLIIYAVIITGVLIATISVFKLTGISLTNGSNDIAIGTAIDSLNGVKVFYNGNIGHVAERNVAKDGYNIGLQWQCVEFVKRYYFEHFHFEMPDAYGNAKDFFNDQLPDASFNDQRGLVQYDNPSLKKPAVDDILVFDGHLGNKYGHIAIISKVNDNSIEIIQQNPGPGEPSREAIRLVQEAGRWRVMHKRALGWLRIE